MKKMLAAALTLAVAASATASTTTLSALGALHTLVERSPSLGPVTRAGLPAPTLVALGDSIPAGDECPGCVPYPELVAQGLSSPGAPAVEVNNLGVGGWTSDDLLSALGPDEPAGLIAADGSVVTITIGANDFFPPLQSYLDGTCGGPSGSLDCFLTLLPHLNCTLNAILTRLAELRGTRTGVAVTGYWDVFPDGDVALADFGPDFLADSAALTREVNTTLNAAATRADAAFIDLLAPFRGPDAAFDPTPLLVEDGEHPNQAGHDAIAAAIIPELNRVGVPPAR